jgi:hypothetical protein
MRTGSQASFSPDLDPSEFNSILEVDTLPGRWLVMGQFDLSCPAPGGNVDFEFRFAAFDIETGEEQMSVEDRQLGRDDFDFPVYYYESASTAAIRFPVTLIGDFANDTDFNLLISMQCRETNSRAWSVTNARLKLIPR